MKIARGVSLRKVGNDKIIVPEGIEVINLNKMVCLNDSAAYLWEALSILSSFETDDAINLLLQRYDVDPETARKDTESLLEEWKSTGIVLS